jgi:hypothetical protein
MAITINTVPSALVTVFKPVLFNVSSDKANSELKIKSKVEYYTGSTWKTLNIHVIDKNNSGSFDCYVHQALNAAIVVSMPQGIHGTIITDTGSIVKYRVRFTELIYDADGLYIESETILSAEYQCTNIVFQAYEAGNEEDFVIVEGDGKVLTDQNNTRTVKSNQPIVISYLYDETEVTPVPEITVLP